MEKSEAFFVDFGFSSARLSANDDSLVFFIFEERLNHTRSNRIEMRLKVFHIAWLLYDAINVHIFEFFCVKLRDELIGIDSYESAFDVRVDFIILEPESQML